MRQQRVSLFQDIALKGFKGVDLSGPSELATSDFLADALNMEIGLKGEVKKRPGIIRKHNGTTLGTNQLKFIGLLYNVNVNQIIVQNLVSGTAGKLWKSVDGGVTWTQISTPAGTNYSCGRGVQYLDVLYIPTATGVAKWDGTVFTAPAAGTVNALTAAAFAKFRMFIYDNTNATLRYSDPGNLLSWPAANSIGFVGDGDTVTNIVSYRDRIVIFRTNSIYLLYLDGPPTSWILKKLPFSIGSSSSNVVVYNDLIYILSWDGVFRTDLTRVDEISIPIKSVFLKRRQTISATGSSGTFDYITYWNNRLICSIKTDLVNVFRCFVYNILNKTWTEWLPALPTALAGPPAYSPIADSLPVYYGKAVISGNYNKEGLYLITTDLNGKIYFFDDEVPVYQDEVNTNYLSKIRTNKIDNGVSSGWKRIPVIYTRIMSASVGVQGRYYVNDVAGILFNIPTDVVLKEIKMKGPGFFRIVELEITDTSANYLEIDEIVLRTKIKTEMTDVAV